MDYQKKDVMTTKTNAQAAYQKKEREIAEMEVMGEMAKTKELEERLHKFVGWEELYSSDLCTDELIERFCQFFGKPYMELMDQVPFEVWLMINFLDTINRYGEEYAYTNMAEAIQENEERLGL